MTERPAIESANDPSGVAVIRTVAAARRRFRLVRTLHLVAIAAPCGVATGAALALAGWAPVWMVVALGALGGLAAAAWEASRTPPPSTVARILDAHLELKDRVAATLQLQGSGSPIAALVARDAAARLAHVNLAALFPLTLGRAPAAATAVGVAMVAWLASVGTEPGRAPAAPTAIDGSASGASDAGSPGRVASRSGQAVASPSQSSASRPPAAAREARGTARGSDPSSEAAAASSTRTTQGPSPTPGDVQGRATTSVSSIGPQAGTTAATTAPPSRAGLGGSAAGRTPNGALSSGAGGATAGNTLASAGNSGTTALTPAAYNAARAGAEAALTRDVVPPDYRDHVRAYFRTLTAETAGTGGSR